MLMAAPAIKGMDLFTHSRPLEQPAASGNCTFSGIVPIARKPLQAEWCLGCGVSWLWESMDPFSRRWSAALQSAPQAEDEYSRDFPAVDQGERRNGLGWSRRVHFPSAPDFRKASRAEV
jgi:hypothetical protein